MSPASSGSPAGGPALWQLLQTTAAQVEGVMRGESLPRLLDKVPATLRSGTQALSFEALRHLGRAQALRRLLAPRKPAAAVDALLCTALALLTRDGGAPYAAHTLVDQAVETAKRQASTRRQAGFVNACLRRFLRESDALLKAVADDPVARWNHPLWWIKQLQSDHPTQWQQLLQANQQPAPMDLRVNLLRGDRGAYLHQLADAGKAASVLPSTAAGVRLARPAPVRDLPGHAEGRVSVQSATAQRAAELLLQDRNHLPLRVLDACAAPGGKTAHLLEWAPQVQLTAIELQPERMQLIEDNLQRLGLRARVLQADAAAAASWWDGELFDAILLDAPCSASGIVRRHPDIRWLRRAEDIDRLAGEQDRLLAALWPLLVPGGRLLFCTCSVFRQEGLGRVDAFLTARTDARLLDAPGQILPLPNGDNGTCDEDGFFYALLQKTGA